MNIKALALTISVWSLTCQSPKDLIEAMKLGTALDGARADAIKQGMPAEKATTTADEILNRELAQHGCRLGVTKGGKEEDA